MEQNRKEMWLHYVAGWTEGLNYLTIYNILIGHICVFLLYSSDF